MSERQGHSIEAHSGSATLYLYGAVSVRGALQAMRECSDLPDAVWLLRVDSRAAQPLDPGTARVLVHALRRWGQERSGCTIFTLPCPERGRGLAGPERVRRRLRLAW